MRQNQLVPAFKSMIIIAIAFAAAQILVRVYSIIILTFVINGNENYRSKLSFIDEEVKIENIVNYIVAFLFFIMLSTWLYVKYSQAHRESRLALSYRPLVALFAFIIPILNLFGPYRIMNEMWVVFNKEMSLEAHGRKQIKIWWFLSIALFVANRYLAVEEKEIPDLKAYLKYEYISLIIFAISIHYRLLLFKLVKMLDG